MQCYHPYLINERGEAQGGVLPRVTQPGKGDPEPVGLQGGAHGSIPLYLPLLEGKYDDLTIKIMPETGDQLITLSKSVSK